MGHPGYAGGSAATPLRESGETGRRTGFRFQRAKALGGSTPPSRTNSETTAQSARKDPHEGRRLAVEAPLDIVQKEWEKAYGRVQKRASLPGFRRGHVPRSLVKLHFADDVRREVAEHLIPDI